MKYKLYAVRHGEAEYNRDNLVMGTVDSPLTSKGIAQAEAIQKQVDGVVFNKVYASPLQRAVRTAEIIGKTDEIKLDTKLIERTFGKLEGKPMEELDKLRGLAPTTHADLWRYNLGEGIESDAEVYNRIKSFVDAEAKEWDNKTILIASHSGPIRALLLGLGFFTEENMRPGTFKNGSCAIVEYENDTFKLSEILLADI